MSTAITTALLEKALFLWRNIIFFLAVAYKDKVIFYIIWSYDQDMDF
jgi:hypothetical protein